MNAPLLKRETTDQGATLKLFALFHLNLAFSSIEEEQRSEVIRRCYWPLLELAKEHGPIGIEATGFTLEEIAARDPNWCLELTQLIDGGSVEFIGSGYAQIVGPLVPAAVNEANLRIGHETYERFLGLRPTLALINEQAYSAGLVGLYLDAGYRAILMDWDNPAAHHPEWAPETRYLPQRARGADGRDIALLWTNTVAFQKLQRLAHGDIAEEEYAAYVLAQRGSTPRAFCLYASDAEIFNFRPGRYRSEEALDSASEWERIARALARLKLERDLGSVTPSQALAIDDATQRAPLRLESAACPVPVKKQRKYSLSRWAVTGRDDTAINAACERIYKAITRDGKADASAWKELCYLWSSDFRTHITEKRWKAYCARLAEVEGIFGAHDEAPVEDEATPVVAPAARARRAHRGHGRMEDTRSIRRSPHHGHPEMAADTPSEERGAAPSTVHTPQPRHIAIETPALKATLDRRRGLAISGLQFRGDDEAIIGGLPHGHFDAIALQADWYTGDCVFEAPGEHKITDLEWCEAEVETAAAGDVVVRANIDTPKGIIRKHLRFRAGEPRVDFSLSFDWPSWDRGVLRLGHITLLPEAFDWNSMSLRTHNGGKDLETFLLKDETADHGAPVSFLVSSSFGIGMTEGRVELGDAKRRVRVDIDRETAPLLGLLTHRQIGGSLFCQLALSALELDETRKPAEYRPGPRRFRFSLTRLSTS